MYQSIHQEGKGIAQQLDRVRARRELAEKKKSKLLEYNVTGQISDRDFLQMNRQCDSEIAQAEREISELEEQQNSDASFREHIATLRRVLEEAKRDAANGLINREFVEKYINSILVTVENDKIDLQIKLFTGEMTTRYLEKLERRTGHTFKKMIESYEQSLANQG